METVLSHWIIKYLLYGCNRLLHRKQDHVKEWIFSLTTEIISFVSAQKIGKEWEEGNAPPCWQTLALYCLVSKQTNKRAWPSSRPLLSHTRPTLAPSTITYTSRHQWASAVFETSTFETIPMHMFRMLWSSGLILWTLWLHLMHLLPNHLTPSFKAFGPFDAGTLALEVMWNQS